MSETAPQPSPRSQLSSLQNHLREAENKYKKEIALLQQKIELLNIELKDSCEREQNTKRLHDTMLNAFRNEGSGESKFGDPNVDKLVQQYEHKVKYLTERNEKLEQITQTLTKAENGSCEKCKKIINDLKEKLQVSIEQNEELERYLQKGSKCN